jgi:hypothetical protein
MNLTIYKHFNPSSHVALYVNDRMSTDDDKNRILFEIAQLNSNNEKINSVIYFMTIHDAKLLCFRLLKDKLKPGEEFHRVKGRSGQARAITIKRETVGIKIKIDNGRGPQKNNGFTTFKEKTGKAYISLNEDSMYTLCLCLKDRIFQRELLMLNFLNR